MPKTMFTCLLLIISVYLFAGSILSAEKTKIGIMRFDVSEKLDPALSGFLYDMLLERMVASRKYTVVDWEEIDRLLNYIEQSQPNVSEDDAKKQAVNQLGIQKMYVGSITKIAGKFYITVKVLNIDLTVEKVQKGSTKSKAGLERSINEIADNLLGLAKEPKEKKIAEQVGRGRLFVETEPKDARIRILNIKPKFYQGIELEPGSYHVEVSYSNYTTQKIWTKLSAGEDKTLTFRLTEATASSLLQQAIDYCTGITDRINEDKAKMLFMQAAEKNDPLAIMWVARCYHRGRCGFSRNESRGRKMAETVIDKIKPLADSRKTGAMFLLASAYREGLAIVEDHFKAVHWYRKATKSGNAHAMNNLGFMYKRGKGVAQDSVQAVFWFRKAAEKAQPRGMTNLGWMYAKGEGVPKDAAQAVFWFRKAAEKAHPLGMNNLGWMYEHGEGVPKDAARAVYWYRKAAEKAQPRGMTNLGWMYAKGEGVAQDSVQAVFWFRKAAEKAHPRGMNNLGWMYEQGKGVARDEVKAVYWYQKAAQKGDALAMANLGRMYDQGKGPSKDKAQAIQWYRKAAEKGNSKAAARLKELGY